MNYICDYCNKKINKTSNIYFAFDSKTCSNICRNYIIDYNIKIDPRMLFPSLWIKNKDKKIIFLETTPKYNYSINNLNKLFITSNNIMHN